MTRLKTLGQRVPMAPRRQGVQRSADRRMTGRALQERRLRVWERDNHCCAECGQLVAPHEFELDHTVPLFLGGADTDENCQVLCAGPDGCHRRKTARDLRGSSL